MIGPEREPAMPDLTIYLDESGNTGDAARTSAESLVDQPAFALVGLGERSGSGQLAALLADLRSRHRVGSREIKGRTMNRYPDLVPDLIKELHDRDIPVLVELMDKRYFIAINVVTYVLGRTWLDPSMSRSLFIANAFADALAEHIDVHVLAAYGDFATLPTATTFAAFVEAFRHAFLVAKLRMGADREEDFELLCTMERSLEAALDTVDDDVHYETFLPPPDRDARGTLLPMLPHVPALTNIYARANRYSQGWSNVRVLHDEQALFGPLLAGYASTLESNRHFVEFARFAASKSADWDFSANRFIFAFARSIDEPGIQLADMLARFCTRQMTSIIATGRAQPDLERVGALLRGLQDPAKSTGINIVSTTKRADCFHRA